MPGLVSETEAFGETTLVVDPARLVDACSHLRDELGFEMLIDVTPTDYLGWTAPGVSGYIGTPQGRNLNRPMTQGLQSLPAPKPKRFSVSYHLLALRSGAPRVRVQIWVDDGEPVPSVIELWPSADWFEREAWDMMGIPIEGHPLRKDYPLGGEPVRFSGGE